MQDQLTDEQRQLMRFVFSSTEFGRPYVFPPEVPQDRVDIMRKAIADAVRDPELVAEALNIKMDMTYTPPEHLEQLVRVAKKAIKVNLVTTVQLQVLKAILAHRVLVYNFKVQKQL